MTHTRFLVAWLVLAVIALSATAHPPIAFDDAGLHAVHFLDAREGWACGDDGAIWHTINGGQSWERMKSGTRASLRGIHFLNMNVGWAVGRLDTPGGSSVGVLLKTTNGGWNWEEVGTNIMPGLSAVKFVDENTGIVGGDSSDAFPTGLFVTTDGGVKWEAVRGPRLASSRSAALLPQRSAALISGAWGELGTLTLPHHAGGTRFPSTYRTAELDPLGGRSLHAVTCGTTKTPQGQPWCFAAGDGGAVLISSDGGKSWGYVHLPFPAAVLAACDFRCIASYGQHVWVAGRPGSIVLHSPDLGKTWEILKTGINVPIHALQFIDENTGWLVGDLGTILGTTDGGKTWKVQKSGGQRAAILFLQANTHSVPLDLVAALGAADGYLCTAVTLMSADPATAQPKRAADDLRLRNALRHAGGASSESSWGFPLAPATAELPPRRLLASWNRAHNGKAAEQLLRQAVLAIRIWQPDVVITDLFSPQVSSAEALAVNVAKEAFKHAADPNAFPEQLHLLGLKVWEPKKLYALSPESTRASIPLDHCSFHPKLHDSPKNFAENASRLLIGTAPRPDRRGLVLIAHRLPGAERHTQLLEGLPTLAPGGTARRITPAPYHDPDGVNEKRRAVEQRRNLEALAALKDPELAGADKVIAALSQEIQKMPDDVAARTTFTIATQLVHEGQWSEAREVFGLIAIHYPGHPLAAEAFRWLARYHASSEARRRNEIQQKLLYQSITLEAPNSRTLPPTGGTATIGSPRMTEDRYQFHSPDTIFKWHAACLELEPKLASLGPVYSRDPAAWLCFLTARRQIGQHAEADKFLADYFKHNPGAAELPPGMDPWRDCLAMEYWLVNPHVIPLPPKPIAICQATQNRPTLDGRLDDACWQNAKPLQLKPHAAAFEKPEDAESFRTRFPTTSYFSYDAQYLYIAVHCAHPAGQNVPPVAKRFRDADLRGHDRIDILLDIDRDYQTYYRFQIDHRGCLAEDCWGDARWNPKYHVAFHSTATEWMAEIAIPLDELTGDRPAHGKSWAVNVSRVVPGEGVLSWSSPAEKEPRPEGMGILQFRADR
ncbi:MAG: YCF48-related protein [Gemmataceae bacterium]|nr:YCF48-related protein [Gemmata sp.]MDW8196551.1 YCF48-related protein [Gemmataceae bacterium]